MKLIGLLALLIAVTCFTLLYFTHARKQYEAEIQQNKTEIQELSEKLIYDEEIVQQYREKEENSKFALDALNSWYEGTDKGQVRMVIAKPSGLEDGLLLVEDDQGERWLINNTGVDEDSNVLLWIGNNYTEDDTTDDTIVAVYVQVQ